MTSGYKAEHAKDGTGLLDWKAGTVASKLKNNQRKVYLSRWLKPVRILSDAETASMYKDIVGDVAVPFNVVPPGLLTELEKVGVNIDYEGSPNYKSHQKRKAEVTQYSLAKDIENSDNSWYNEIKLSATEQDRVQSEALTWNASKRNQLITQTLSNGITYRYVIDDEGIVHIYEKEQSVNIHDWGENYGNTDTTQLDSITEELWTGQRDNSGDSSLSQDGRKPRKDDTNDNYIVSREGRSNGTGYSKDRTNAYRKPKKRHWHFNDDGSTEVTYSDGSKEILDIAPTKEASSTDGVFFDGKNKIQHSLRDSDDSYSRIYDMRVEVNKLTESIREFEKTEEFKNAMNALSEAVLNDDIANGAKAYAQWRKDSG